MKKNVNIVPILAVCFIIGGLICFGLYGLFEFEIIKPSGSNVNMDMLFLAPVIGTLFFLTGILIPNISRQNVFVGSIEFLSVFLVTAIECSIFMFIKNNMTGFYIGLGSAGIFLFIILLLALFAKKAKQLRFYKPAKAITKVPKDELLKNCVKDLYSPDLPWEISVEGDAIIGRIDWKNTTSFSFAKVSNELKNFEYRVNLTDDYKFFEVMVEKERTGSVSPAGASLHYSYFYGISLRYYKSFEVGINNKTGETGIIKTEFSTQEIRDKIRHYVEERGYKY